MFEKVTVERYKSDLTKQMYDTLEQMFQGEVAHYKLEWYKKNKQSKWTIEDFFEDAIRSPIFRQFLLRWSAYLKVEDKYEV